VLKSANYVHSNFVTVCPLILYIPMAMAARILEVGYLERVGDM
jgi:hypothetical protein